MQRGESQSFADFGRFLKLEGTPENAETKMKEKLY